MTPHITEILADINTNPEHLSTKYKDNAAVRQALQYAFDSTKRFVLPEGTPPFKPDAAPIGMSPGNFYQQVRKFYIFCRTDLTAVRREQLFIQLLEGLHPTEAEIMVLIKDQCIDTKYPNITADLIESAGLVSKENIFRQVHTPEGAAKHHVVKLSESAETKESFGAPPTPKRAAKPKATPKPAEPKETPAAVVVEELVKKTRGRAKKVA